MRCFLPVAGIGSHPRAGLARSMGAEQAKGSFPLGEERLPRFG